MERFSYQVWIAYILWVVGGFGCLGLHRFYLRKVPTGLLWVFTGGLAMVGSIYDLVTLPRQVDAANRTLGPGFGPESQVLVPVRREKEPLERAILQTAAAHAGRVSTVQVAAASDWTLDQVQKRLDEMARKGVCELRVLRSGSVVYHFPDFDPTANQEFEV